LRISRESSSLRHQVEDVLRKAIANGRFGPGQRIVERELCEMTGVSRPSIREALRRLEAEGLIDMVPHRGPMVASMSVEEARQIYAVRALLEGYAAQEFARVATQEEIARLKQEMRAIEIAARPAGKAGIVEAVGRFYEVLLTGCRNEIVRKTLLGLLNRVNVLRMTSMSQKDRLPKTVTELRGMLARIVARDPEGARRATVLHIDNAAHVALQVLARLEAGTEKTRAPHARSRSASPGKPAKQKRKGHR
jgi:DNA-binding GntR family transcriptional regulator